jgi:hypothetical protein
MQLDAYKYGTRMTFFYPSFFNEPGHGCRSGTRMTLFLNAHCLHREGGGGGGGGGGGWGWGREIDLIL